MYTRLGRQGGYREPAGAHDRQLTAEHHVGTARQMLRRHEQEAHRALRDRDVRTKLMSRLHHRVADPRNLMAAIQHVRSEGGGAPGPNGRTLDGLDGQALWQLARALGRAIKSNAYRPGRDRTTPVPKTSGHGTRIITIRDVEDRVVERAILQIVQPLIDPRFEPTSLAYRPAKECRQALAMATKAIQQGRVHVVKADLRDAFDSVPISRLLDVLRKHIQNEELIGLIETVVRKQKGRGIRQGGCLSPLLLNLYLDHHLDKPWRRRHPTTPLLRVADDMLLLCRSAPEAQTALEALRRLLTPTGMQLHPRKTITADLRLQQVEWVGYVMTTRGGGIRHQIAEEKWQELRDALHTTMQEDMGAHTARSKLLGWMPQLGPTLQHLSDQRDTIRRILTTARETGLEDLPTETNLQTALQHSRSAWRHTLMQTQIPGGGAGSASAPLILPVETGGSGETPSVLPVDGLSDITLYAAGAHLTGSGAGGWAYMVMRADHPDGRARGGLRRTTRRHALLTAVVRALESLPGPSRVRLVVRGPRARDRLRALLPAPWECPVSQSGEGSEASAFERLCGRMAVQGQRHHIVMTNASADVRDAQHLDACAAAARQRAGQVGVATLLRGDQAQGEHP